MMVNCQNCQNINNMSKECKLNKPQQFNLRAREVQPVGDCHEYDEKVLQG